MRSRENAGSRLRAGAVTDERRLAKSLSARFTRRPRSVTRPRDRRALKFDRAPANAPRRSISRGDQYGRLEATAPQTTVSIRRQPSITSRSFNRGRETFWGVISSERQTVEDSADTRIHDRLQRAGYEGHATHARHRSKYDRDVLSSNSVGRETSHSLRRPSSGRVAIANRSLPIRALLSAGASQRIHHAARAEKFAERQSAIRAIAHCSWSASRQSWPLCEKWCTAAEPRRRAPPSRTGVAPRRPDALSGRIDDSKKLRKEKAERGIALLPSYHAVLAVRTSAGAARACGGPSILDRCARRIRTLRAIPPNASKDPPS